jgi:hypothetical protein
VIITIGVMTEDQKWFGFENGSYTNESPLRNETNDNKHSIIKLCQLHCSLIRQIILINMLL